MRERACVLVFAALTLACGESETPKADERSARPSAGCEATGGQTGFRDGQTLTVSGAARTYAVFVPDSYDAAKRYPLVFVFHGDGGTGAGMRKTIDLESASEGGAVVVYPDGFGGWDLDSPAGQNADIAFVDALAAAMADRYCIDRSRVFSTGYSSGAYFSNQLGCRRGSLFRGIASHAGGGPYGADDEYDESGRLVCPEAPVAALLVHGLDDGTVLPTEGQNSREHWRAVNGCDETSSPYAPNPCVAHTGCAAARPVVWCAVSGLEHTVWSRGAEVTWKFFSALP